MDESADFLEDSVGEHRGGAGCVRGGGVFTRRSSFLARRRRAVVVVKVPPSKVLSFFLSLYLGYHGVSLSPLPSLFLFLPGERKEREKKAEESCGDKTRR